MRTSIPEPFWIWLKWPFFLNFQSGIEEEDEEISRLRISPPPTPVHRFLQSVNLYKKNQIKVSIPKFVLRGMGRNSYHVFEVKVGRFAKSRSSFVTNNLYGTITSASYKLFLVIHIVKVKKYENSPYVWSF